MQLDSVELYKKLYEKGVSYLYHANTLTTSLGFIYNGGLLSRGEMENRGILQTNQESDDTDKEFNVWNDIFLDTVDLHGYRYSGYSRQNFYGPVLFELKTELLLDSAFKNVWITTNNPSNWNEAEKEQDRYFNKVNTYIMDMDNNRQQKMITIRNINVPLPFNKYLNCIKLDNPKRKFIDMRISGYDYAFDKLYKALSETKLNVQILEHECNNCYCIRNYNDKDEVDFNKYFREFEK